LRGDLLHFHAGRAADAYHAIDDLEPRHLYKWHQQGVDAAGREVQANLLLGAAATHGSHRLDYQWSSRRDPLFNEGLTEVARIIDPQMIEPPNQQEIIHLFFRYQMGYLLLWSAIERYASLRWGFDGGVMQRVGRVAREASFAQALTAHATPGRMVYRADDPGRPPLILDPRDPGAAIAFYYQVRSNITHRGKAAYDEIDLVYGCLRELHEIFCDVLRAVWNGGPAT
jgi:hypothetical protein